MSAKPRPAGTAKHVFIGVYGDPGIGKTRLIGTTPGKVLIIRTTQSHLDSFLPEDQRRAERGEIMESVVADWDDMMEVQTHLREEGGQYDWVWLEDAQSMFDVLLDDIWDSVRAAKPARDQKHLGLDQGEYGRNMERYSRWLRHAAVGPDLFNFGYATWAETAASPDKDADGDPIEKLMPYVQGKGMPAKFAGYMKIVGYYTKAQIGGETKRVLKTESSPGYYAKDAMGGALGGRVIEPTMPKIIEAIKTKRGGGDQPASRTTTTRRPRVVRRSR